MIDLRSDTVTRPTPAMRHAMADAPVGDDVYGEDPTVNRLEAEVAARLGFPAALFVPSGTMANQIAIQLLAQPGDSGIVGDGAHNWWYETGAAAALGGVQLDQAGRGGLFDEEDVRAGYKPDVAWLSRTRFVSVENTHNKGGGRVWPMAQLDRVRAAARALGLALHLDGARLWNAHVATGRAMDELAAGFDTVSLCLSKGLGAPVGSLLVSDAERIARARRLRKMLGGGMRQAGILAAAGLYAIAHHVARLADDHAHARALAEALAAGVYQVDLAATETNIVMADLPPPLPTADAVVARARQEGLLVSAFGPRRLRLVTHLDVDAHACARAAEILNRVALSA